MDVAMNVRAPEALVDRVDAIAEDEMRSRSSTVRKLIVEALDRRREPVDVKAAS